MRFRPFVFLAAAGALCFIPSCNEPIEDPLDILKAARVNMALPSATLQVGSDRTVEAFISNIADPGSLELTWVSETPAVATVVPGTRGFPAIDQATVHAVSAGETWVRVFVRGGEAAGRDSMRIIVQGVPEPQIGIQRLEPALDPTRIAAGDTFVVVVAVQNATNPSVTYSASNSEAVRFVKRGNNAWIEVLSKVRGAVTLRATVDGTTASVSQPVEIIPLTLYSVTLSEHDVSLFQTGTKTLGCTFRNSRSLWPFAWDSTRWSSANPGLVSVDGTGKVTANAPGQTKVFCRLRDGETADSALVTVRTMRLTVTPNPATLRVGGVAQLSTQLKDELDAAISGQSISFTSNDNAIARVDTPNILRGVEAGNTTVRASVVAFPNVFVDVPVIVQPLSCGPTGLNVTTLRTQVVTDPGNQAATVNMPGTLAISIARTSNVFTVSAAAPFGSVSGPVDPLGTVCALFLSGTTTIAGLSVPVELAGAYPPGGVQEWTFRVLLPAGTVTYRLQP